MNKATQQTERPDALRLAHAALLEGVRTIVTGEDWHRMLDMAQRFRDYSPHNCVLIFAQLGTATRVAGYRTWQALGRQVREGERALRILAPISKTKTDDETGERRTVVIGWRLVPVFDVSQTEGEPLPDVGPDLLLGNAPEGLWATLTAQIEAEGFSVQRGDCGPANGWTDHKRHVVQVRDDVTEAQAVKTLAHELAHVLLHPDSEAYRTCRGRAEVEAESVAYLVCHAAGVPSGSYSFPYVAGWSGGDMATIQETAELAIATARRISAGMESERRGRLCESLPISA